MEVIFSRLVKKVVEATAAPAPSCSNIWWWWWWRVSKLPQDLQDLPARWGQPLEIKYVVTVRYLLLVVLAKLSFFAFQVVLVHYTTKHDIHTTYTKFNRGIGSSPQTAIEETFFQTKEVYGCCDVRSWWALLCIRLRDLIFEVVNDPYTKVGLYRLLQ